MKEQLAEVETSLRQSETKLVESNAKLQQSETELAKSTIKLQQSEAKFSQAIQSTITMLQNMGCDDTFICSKLCEVYRLSESEALFYLEKK